MHPVRSPCCVFVVSVVDISMNSNRKEGSVFIPSEEGYTTNTTNQMGKKDHSRNALLYSSSTLHRTHMENKPSIKRMLPECIQ